jgi:Domain of unknown function (DUF3127)
MALEIEGNLIKFLPEVTGQGAKGPWVKQEFVIETQEQYPKKVCMSAWGDRVQDLKNYALGDALRVTFGVESREYNERWYTDVRVIRIDSVGGTGGGGNAAPQASTQPKPQPSKPAELPPAGDLSSFTEGDDLPF